MGQNISAKIERPSVHDNQTHKNPTISLSVHVFARSIPHQPPQFNNLRMIATTGIHTHKFTNFNDNNNNQTINLVSYAPIELNRRAYRAGRAPDRQAHLVFCRARLVFSLLA